MTIGKGKGKVLKEINLKKINVRKPTYHGFWKWIELELQKMSMIMLELIHSLGRHFLHTSKPINDSIRIDLVNDFKPLQIVSGLDANASKP